MLRLRGQSESSTQEGAATFLKFRKGEIVYAQGDCASDWFKVISGTIRTCYLYRDGHRQLTGFFYSGDVFGIDDDHYSSSAEAVTAVTLRRCPRNFSDGAILSEPPLAQGAYQIALNHAQACIYLLGRRTAAERMAVFLLRTAKRFGVGKPFALPMSRADIADHLGLTIHTVSRTLSEFVRRELISLDGPQYITVEDASRLALLADGEDEACQTNGCMPRAVNTNSARLIPQFGN
jgi:CRP/FNR family transcriptional regulator, nitrogen fixation regulation protein